MNALKTIIGEKGTELKGKKIVLCVTGSVAACRSPEIARELMRHGAEVFPVMSNSAQGIIHPNLMHWATGNKPITAITGECEHIQLAGEHLGKADLVLIAPATANTIGKIVWGVDDTTVTTVATTAIGSKIPLIVVPAMHRTMYAQPFVQANLEKLKKAGILIIEPKIEGEKAKIAESEEIVDTVVRALHKKDLDGKNVVVTAGATREFMDGVRFISNPSTGRMGIAAAREAWLRGAEVMLIAGRIERSAPSYLRIVNVESTEEMSSAVEKYAKSADIVVLAGAPSDFTVKKNSGKISSEKKNIELKLEATKKISDSVRKRNRNAKLVLFKAEVGKTDAELKKAAIEKMRKCGADLIVANDVGRKGAGFGTETNEVLIIDKKGRMSKAKGRKNEIAGKIFDAI